MDWFESLTGFRELDYASTQARFVVDQDRLTSRANGRSWSIGAFELAPLAELRRRAAGSAAPGGKPTMRIVEGDVRTMHAAPEYAGALFQVASQFNALEMVRPDVAPEDGVTRYQHDPTQGPACAMAAAPATIFRNYFAPVAGVAGQRRDRQIDGLADIGAALAQALGRPATDLWEMRNGYALCTREGLDAISRYLANLDAGSLDDLRGRLSIAIQRGVEVTEPGAGAGNLVSQAFCSALPISYTGVPLAVWRPFASLVLEAAYEATLLEGAIGAAHGGSRIVLLTLVGGGVFGNDVEWIYAAIRRALRQVQGVALDVRIVSRGAPSRSLRSFVDSFTDFG